MLAYKRFPAAHWPKISSTNPIERANAEIKRRTDVVGIFPNEAAILRLVGAILMELHNEWAARGHRYIAMETARGDRPYYPCQPRGFPERWPAPAKPETLADRPSATPRHGTRSRGLVNLG